MTFSLYIFSFLTVWLLYKSYSAYKNNKILLDRGIVTDGYISKIETKKELDSDSSKTYHTDVPYMSYTDKNGQNITFKITMTSDLAKYHQGESYKIVYDPKDELKPIILTKFGLWGETLGYLACALFLLSFIIIIIKTNL
ncbi:MAG TPA: hypothetical protein P5235_08145 [Saprospiraceae bacterium]|nr:hypothetical protein [Saprospiraceae bacterium]